MTTFLDLGDQVQDILGPLHGGTGNVRGYASERVILAYTNDTGGAVARGSIVRFRGSNDPRAELATGTGDLLVGVVVGTVGTNQTFEDADPLHNEQMAVCVSGRCTVLVASSVTAGQFAVLSSTPGKAAGSSQPAGAIGHFESSGASSATLVLAGLSSSAGVYTINAVITNGGLSVPPIGPVLAVSVDVPGTIVSARMLSLQTGTAVVNIKKCTYAGYPGSLASICGSSRPRIDSARKSEDTVLSGWTKDIAAGDILQFELDADINVYTVTCALKVRRA